MDPVTIITAVTALAKLVQEFRRNKSWSSEEERNGFESQIKKELDILSDNDTDNDPERWRKPFVVNEKKEGEDA